MVYDVKFNLHYKKFLVNGALYRYNRSGVGDRLSCVFVCEGVRVEKLFRVGELIEYTGLSRQTVHLYTQMQLITEKRRSLSNYRLYSEDVFRRIETIKALQENGYTLLKIKDICDSKKEKEYLKKRKKRNIVS